MVVHLTNHSDVQTVIIHADPYLLNVLGLQNVIFYVEMVHVQSIVFVNLLRMAVLFSLPTDVQMAVVSATLRLLDPFLESICQKLALLQLLVHLIK